MIFLRPLTKNKFLYYFLSKLNYLRKEKKLGVLFYNIEKDFINNRKVYEKFNLDFDPRYEGSYREKSVIKYKLFTALSKKELKIQKILEIGTWDGEFSHLLSNLFPESEIFTIDLPHTDERFINSYNRRDQLNNFIEKRSDNLNKKNIKFIEIDSENLLEKFEKNSFDIIWVDGDHHDPTVTRDIFNSYEILKKNGLMIVDDLLLADKPKNSKKHASEGSSTDGMVALEKLSKEKKCDFSLLTKFYGPRNYFKKSYNAILKK